MLIRRNKLEYIDYNHEDYFFKFFLEFTIIHAVSLSINKYIINVNATWLLYLDTYDFL